MAEKKKWLDKDNINLMVAVCAVLISAASFYAAYVQSLAAERQVKAETWPFMQVSHGNFDVETNNLILNYRIVNAGVGPAYLKSLSLRYKNAAIEGFGDILAECCIEEGETRASLRPFVNNVITGRPPPVILPPGDHILLFSWAQTPENKFLWQRIDAARWNITGEACYCSLLDECFQTDFVSDPSPVAMCKIAGKTTPG